MARKVGTLQQQRNRMKTQYKRGRLTEKIIRSDGSLSDTEREIAQTVACYLKAQDFSFTYIGEALGISPNTVKAWFSDADTGPELRAAVREIQEDFVQGAIKLVKTYLIELIEMLMTIARTTDDEAMVLKVFTEFADRVGMSKVNKSESAARVETTDHHSIDITDRTGLVDAVADASPEVQQAMARKMDEMMALAQEAGVKSK